ncbi:CTP:molybdopterin cytidylyltransferase [Paramagnetospirillum magnetotacticum MS-1]|uniref:CTP:molybdopterin cytidylyltransferase n=1 Tax=Paramagnetospirillum magnetotacticum MS-1 TaxID=272627 RepID=A0A0C2UD12_PARME|nr:nucleotidyltransferase family protein [Paramagnetospirillum magnetotacticum]KIL99397.1 CTP:molybdopterin cytidylyltransferase [Paramagnetospirillum magnetotacticum MS-1]
MSIAGLILAAGRASRMGGDKRLMRVEGRSMLDLAVEAGLRGGLSPVLVVTGPEPQPDLGPGVVQVVNADPSRGMASSLAEGVAALPEDAEGVMVLLADMPRVTSAHVAALIAAFRPDSICVPVFQGRRGNPVLLSRRFFPSMRDLTGDKGARGLIAENALAVIEVAVADDGILIDVDTPEALRALGGEE